MPSQHVGRLAEEIRDRRLGIKALCAARTLEVDIRPVVEISQRVGIPIEVAAFIGSSPIRQYAEGWTLEQMVDNTRKAVRFARQNQLPVMFVTEDTTRAHPETLRQLFGTAIDEGAERVAVCDTVGHATPEGVRAIIRHVRAMLDEMNPQVGLDWHGHSDRGLGLINAIEAAVAGADRIHGCALGLGERVGNTHLDLLLVNFKLLGWIDTDLSKLKEMGEVISRRDRHGNSGELPGARSRRLPHRDRRARRRRHQGKTKGRRVAGQPGLLRRARRMFGCEQVIEIGPMSGESNVVYWLQQRAIEPKPELVSAIVERAKRGSRLLSEEDVYAIVREGSITTRP